MNPQFLQRRLDGSWAVYELTLVNVLPANHPDAPPLGASVAIPAGAPQAPAPIAGEIAPGVKADDPRIMFITLPRKTHTEIQAREAVGAWLGERPWQMVRSAGNGLTEEVLRQFWYAKVAPPSAFRDGTHRYVSIPSAPGGWVVVADPRAREHRNLPSASSIPGAKSKVEKP